MQGYAEFRVSGSASGSYLACKLCCLAKRRPSPQELIRVYWKGIGQHHTMGMQLKGKDVHPDSDQDRRFSRLRVAF